jgi:hypothetical protein
MVAINILNMLLVEFDFTDEERKKEKKRHNKRRKYLMTKRRKKYKWNYCHHWNVVGFMKVID